VILHLPLNDEWPFLTCQMFKVPFERPHDGTYRNQVIHIGASMKWLELDWPQWVAKFEALLRRMYWFSAVVHLSPEWGGRFDYRWEAERSDVDGFLASPPRPVTHWRFTGGPMRFVPYGVHPDEPNAAAGA
jgi:hypothetical protein